MKTAIKARWIPTLRAIADAGPAGTSHVDNVRAAQALQRRGLVRHPITTGTWHLADGGAELLAHLDAPQPVEDYAGIFDVDWTAAIEIPAADLTVGDIYLRPELRTQYVIERTGDGGVSTSGFEPLRVSLWRITQITDTEIVMVSVYGGERYYDRADFTDRDVLILSHDRRTAADGLFRDHQGDSGETEPPAANEHTSDRPVVWEKVRAGLYRNPETGTEIINTWAGRPLHEWWVCVPPRQDVFVHPGAEGRCPVIQRVGTLAEAQRRAATEIVPRTRALVASLWDAAHAEHAARESGEIDTSDEIRTRVSGLTPEHYGMEIYDRCGRWRILTAVADPDGVAGYRDVFTSDRDRPARMASVWPVRLRPARPSAGPGLGPTGTETGTETHGTAATEPDATVPDATVPDDATVRVSVPVGPVPLRFKIEVRDGETWRDARTGTTPPIYRAVPAVVQIVAETIIGNAGAVLGLGPKDPWPAVRVSTWHPGSGLTGSAYLTQS